MRLEFFRKFESAYRVMRVVLLVGDKQIFVDSEISENDLMKMSTNELLDMIQHTFNRCVDELSNKIIEDLKKNECEKHV